MPESLINVSYLGAAILFILALGGLKDNQSARRGNLYGMIGMTIAVLVTIFAFVSKNHNILIAVM
ncbi:MAG: NAD(P)(+) transhydrogenase (Re/Si-specific) subunit beta, partial [Gammaproteobacteria bacterium]